MDLLTQDLYKAFLESESYRNFLKKTFEIKKRHNKNFSYASFANRAGLSSKAHLREIILNNRRITPKTLPSITKGFDFKGPLKIAFETLVQTEEKDFYHQNRGSKSLASKLQSYRDKIKSALLDDKPNIQAFSKKLSNPAWTVTYAALGDVNEGKTLDSIVKLTNFSKAMCLKWLKILQELNLVDHNSHKDLYFAKELNLVLKDFGQSEFYKLYYLKSIERIKRQTELKFSSPEKLFMASHLTVSSANLKTIKKDLVELLTEYISSIEDSQGDKLITLTVGLA